MPSFGAGLVCVLLLGACTGTLPDSLAHNDDGADAADGGTSARDATTDALATSDAGDSEDAEAKESADAATPGADGGTDVATPAADGGTDADVPAHDSAIQDSSTDAPALDIFRFTTAMTQAQFRAAVADMSYDVIEMAHGVYAHWHVVLNVDRTARPLTIRPAPGATVTFDDTSPTSTAGLFQIGNGAKAAHLTFDGTGGRFVIQNYSIRSTGLVWTGYAEHITMKGFTVRNNAARDGAASNGQQEHTVYASMWNGNRGDHLTFDDWDVTTGALGKLNGLHIYHSPAAINITARNWIVRGSSDARCYWAVVSIPTTNLVLRDWSIDYTIVPMSIGDGSTGRIENVTSLHGQNPPSIPAGMVQVNNSWSPG